MIYNVSHEQMFVIARLIDITQKKMDNHEFDEKFGPWALDEEITFLKDILSDWKYGSDDRERLQRLRNENLSELMDIQRKYRIEQKAIEKLKY